MVGTAGLAQHGWFNASPGLPAWRQRKMVLWSQVGPSRDYKSSPFPIQVAATSSLLFGPEQFVALGTAGREFCKSLMGSNGPDL